MSQEDLHNKLVRKFEGRKKLGINELKSTGETRQVPVYLSFLDAVILTGHDWREIGNVAMMELINSVAAACGLFPLEDNQYAWDLPVEEKEKLIPKKPTPLPESRIEVRHRPPTAIAGHIPPIDHTRRHRNADGIYPGTDDGRTYGADE